MRARRLIVLGTATMLLLVPAGLATGHPSHPAPRARYTVQAGDTLWSIARRAAPGRDPRPVVDQLVDDNHLRGQLQAGQELLVPPAAAAPGDGR